MSRQCGQCREPLGEFELSLKCANPRCTALCHPPCASGPSLLNDGGRVPRWRCSECQLLSSASASSYESVYGRPRPGDTLKRIKDDWGINRTIDALHLREGNRGYFDRGSNYRASTGALLGKQRPTDLDFSLPVRPKSVILTPTPTEDDKTIMEPTKDPPPPQPVPTRIVTPDEKYDETVKSFYKWLEEHECASKDKSANRGSLVKDKIAQFGAKLEDHLASRTADKSDLGRAKQHPVPKSGTKRANDTWPKTQAHVAKTHDPLQGRFYSGKLIEAEKGEHIYGTLNRPAEAAKPSFQPVKSTTKPQNSDYSGIYANQRDLGRGGEKSHLKGIQEFNKPTQPNMPTTGAVGTNHAVYANQPELQNVASQYFTGRFDSNREPAQITNQSPHRSNLRFDSHNSSSKGDFGFAKPEKTEFGGGIRRDGGGVQPAEASLKPIFGKPKSSSTRKPSDFEEEDSDEDFPPPPLETDLDESETAEVKVKSAEETSGDAMAGRKSFNVREDDRRGLSVGREVLEDARVVKHASPARGTFTLSIVNSLGDTQVSYAQIRAVILIDL
ncbi:hypothetical protein GE061_012562 [Apolygus lucorum]|uniref:Uncharacterized protein n=1 Tax=Apolygus lucorum TaxID=248454 RepID=A0A8S9XTW3_APOLU|nr:hypothetical protein GE061_012562 [Apolygus lucorum]